MATKAPWDITPQPTGYVSALSKLGVNEDYGSLGTLLDVPKIPQNAANPAWSGMPEISFPMAGNGPVGSSFMDSDFMKGMLGKRNKDGTQDLGWGGMALGTAQGLFSGYMGMKNYGLAKDSLEQGKKQFQMNYDAQKQTTNTALEDRQRARVANNPNSVGVDEYMNKNRIA